MALTGKGFRILPTLLAAGSNGVRKGSLSPSEVVYEEGPINSPAITSATKNRVYRHANSFSFIALR